MKRPLLFFAFIAFSFFTTLVSAQPVNDNCGSATTLTSGTPQAGTVLAATASGAPVGCAVGNPDDDVWYKFTTGAGTPVATISFTSIGTELAATGAMLQLYSGTCPGAPVSVACGNGAISPLVVSGLAATTTYFIRVYSYATGALTGGAAGSGFTIKYVNTITPSNDDCSGAVLLPTAGVAFNSGGWFAGATTNATPPAGACTGPINWDVWYKFVATKTNPTITLSNNTYMGGTVPANTRIQLLAGPCGAFTSSLFCGTSPLAPTGLTIGTTYYVRVYNTSAAAFTPATANKNFNIAVTDPGAAPVTDSTASLFYMDTVARNLGFPWEITYGPDDSLWITEARGYRVVRISADRTGANETTPVQQILKLPLGGNGNPSPTFTRTIGTWPQGGMEGLAIHPLFKTDTSKQWVYIAYVYNGTCPGSPAAPCIFRSKIVRCRWYYATDQGNPYGKDTLVIKDTLISNLSGSNDHNSGRLKIGPTPEGPDNTYKLYYTIGDMGAGQFNNASRTNNAQNRDTCEGKILRLNTQPDADGTPGSPIHDFDRWREWIPNDNPFTHTVNGLRTPVYSYGHRNAQGLAWGNVNGTWRLYESEHGDRAGDEVNIIEAGGNYGWPRVTGMADDNYASYDDLSNGFTSNDILASQNVPDEITFAENLPNFKRPVFDLFNWTSAQIQAVDPSAGSNIFTWPTVATSGIEFYNGNIPGWKNSLIVISLKYGAFRLKLNANGDFVDSTITPNATDTLPLLHSWRVRDIAYDASKPNSGKFWVIIDSTGSTSGPTGGFTGGNAATKSGGKILLLTFKTPLTLPVHFETFTGKLLPDKTVALEWKAETDQQHDHFEVEKSADRNSFMPIGIVTDIRSVYSLIDHSPYIGNNYYRIKQVDKDGKATYTKIINIIYDPSLFLLTVYPNPVKDVLSIKVSMARPDHIQVQIFDMQGHLMYTKSKFVQNGMGEMQVDTKSWPAQMYSIKIIDGNNKLLGTQKVVKQ